MRRHLPVFDDRFLDEIRIATPCSADWSAMPGDERVRKCPDCRLRVYNVAEMTRPEAAALLRSHEGQRVCLRVFRRSDGTLLTQDCWERLRAARQRGWVAFGVALAIVLVTQLGLRIVGLRALLEWYGSEPAPIEAPISPTMTGAPAAIPLSPIPTVAAQPTGAPPPSRRMGRAKMGKPVTPKTGGIEGEVSFRMGDMGY